MDLSSAVSGADEAGRIDVTGGELVERFLAVGLLATGDARCCGLSSFLP
jgi:hypothetical protein